MNNCPTCPTCQSYQRSIARCHSAGAARILAKQLLEHKLTAHPHKAKSLPWDNLPELSPTIASVIERNN